MHLLPWKKAAKVTRISRIVADLQPPKRGGSLVVETGFPTSLIDLFVKNRDRLKRPSSVKKKSKRSRKRCDENDARRVDSVGAESDPGRAEPKGSELGVWELKAEEKPRSSNGSENRSPGKAEFVEMRRSTGTEAAGEREVAAEEEEEEEEDEDEEVAPDVFMAVVKVFAVAVLALSTKKLVVGITLSAFALLFLELVAKRLLPRFAGGFRRIRERQSSKSESDSEEEEFVPPPRKQPSPETLHGIKLDEVRIRPELEELSRDKKWGFLDEKDILNTDQAPALDTTKVKNKSKRGKIRRKIIKTLRSVSKKKKLETKMGDDYEREKSEAFEDAEETGDDSVRLSLLSEEAAVEEGEEEVEEEVVVVVVEEQIVEEEEEEKGMKWLVVIIICGAVLLGLCWGRIFAVLLTIVWCLAMKLIGIIGTDQQKSSFTLTQPC